MRGRSSAARVACTQTTRNAALDIPVVHRASGDLDKLWLALTFVLILARKDSGRRRTNRHGQALGLASFFTARLALTNPSAPLGDLDLQVATVAQSVFLLLFDPTAAICFRHG